MRNGNVGLMYIGLMILLSFLPYLWGMETPPTTSHFIIKFLKFLPYLWGMETQGRIELVKEGGEFLPYLWGMETIVQCCSNKNQTHVLTVPMRNGNTVKDNNNNTIFKGSYRAYEEWKQWSKVYFDIFLLFRSYRTYEEWKLRCYCRSVGVYSSVLTVPMRNGNLS